MKKKVVITFVISIILIFIAIVVLLIIFTGPKKHTHKYGDWKIEKEATCTETGRRYHECECGDRQYEDIPALQHNYVDGICTVCGNKK